MYDHVYRAGCAENIFVKLLNSNLGVLRTSLCMIIYIGVELLKSQVSHTGLQIFS